MKNPIERVYIPESSDIRDLKPGDYALNPFGRFGTVAEINYRSTDVNGLEFVGFSVRIDDKATITNSYKEGEIVRTVALSNKYDANEVRELEGRFSDV